MDELEAIRRFRQHAPAASDEATSTARLALEAAIERAERGPARRARWTPRRLAPLTAAVVLVVALLVSGPLLGGRDSASNAAAEELTQLAKVALNQASDTSLVGLREGEFAYTRSESLWTSSVVNLDNSQYVVALVPYTREIWIGRDGSGRIRQTAGEPVLLTDGAEIPEDASLSYDLTFGPGELTNPLEVWGLTTDELLRLAEDPDELARVLRGKAAGTKNPVDYELFVIVGDMLRESAAPPQVRAALYQVAAAIEGVELVGETTDEAGRSGMAVAMTHAGVRHELIFDAETSALLGERDTLLEPKAEFGNAPAGTVIGYVNYLASGIVSSTGATP